MHDPLPHRYRIIARTCRDAQSYLLDANHQREPDHGCTSQGTPTMTDIKIPDGMKPHDGSAKVPDDWRPRPIAAQTAAHHVALGIEVTE
jgi:hypothetical protein